MLHNGCYVHIHYTRACSKARNYAMHIYTHGYTDSFRRVQGTRTHMHAHTHKTQKIVSVCVHNTTPDTTLYTKRRNTESLLRWRLAIFVRQLQREGALELHVGIRVDHIAAIFTQHAHITKPVTTPRLYANQCRRRAVLVRARLPLSRPHTPPHRRRPHRRRRTQKNHPRWSKRT